MADSTVLYTPDSQANNVLPWMLAGQNNGGLFGGNGWGGGILGFFLGLLFGNGWGGFGNGFGGWGGGSGAGFLSNQISNDSGRELLMNAINSNGEASRAAVQNLATALGQDFNLVNSAVQTLQSGLSTLAMQQAVSVPQIINSIQSGNSALASQLASCCCENRLAICEQTNTLGTAITGASQRNVDAISDLKTTMVKEFCDAKERDMQNEINRQGDIITQLRSQISNDKQTEAFTSAFNVLNQKITDLAARQPNTVPVQWPALTAVNTTPYVNGGYYGNGWGFGNGVNF